MTILFIDKSQGLIPFIASSGRSGTTWLEEVINFRGNYRVLFEPFWGAKVPACRNFHRRQYIRPQDDAFEFLIPARRIVSGKIRNTWIDNQNQLRIYRRRLIKDVRANLMVGWLRANFPELRILFLIRNPFAVAASSVRMGWRAPIHDLLEQGRLVDDFLQPHRETILLTTDRFEAFIVQWSIETLVPLKTLSPDHVLVVFYEHLITEPRRELGRMEQFLGVDLSKVSSSVLRRPSRLVRNGSAVLRGDDLLRSWAADVGASSQQRAKSLLAEFGVDWLYGEDHLPVCSGEDVWGFLDGSCSSTTEVSTRRGNQW